MSSILDHFEEVWLVDFEFHQPDGHLPVPACMAAREVFSGREIKLDEKALISLAEAPFNTGPNSVMVAYLASSELSCFLALGWKMPAFVLDLFFEFRNVTNGHPLPCGNGLLGALAHIGRPSMSSETKDAMRGIAIRGGPYTGEEMSELLDYCMEDTRALEPVLDWLLPSLDRRSLHRGRYAIAQARMEKTGIPIDTELLDQIITRWPEIELGLIEKLAGEYGIFEGTTFVAKNFARHLIERGIPWPTLPSGSLDMKDETFKDMAVMHPHLQPIRQLRRLRSQLGSCKLPVGADGRNRCSLRPFASKTGRNQPSSAKFVFGLAGCLRGLVKPKPGRALAYIDWSQQEFAIAGVLSGDTAMMQTYQDGDPYMSFARRVGAVPPEATKHTHPQERSKFKTMMLGMQYFIGKDSLAERLRTCPLEAQQLLDMHRSTYATFWAWSDRVVSAAMLTNMTETQLGWKYQVQPGENPRTLRNFQMQATGAEIMRIACINATEAGISVCCPVHDAILVEADEAEIEDVVTRTQTIMREAGEVVLDGFQLATDVQVIRYPGRYQDEKGQDVWATLMELVGVAALPRVG